MIRLSIFALISLNIFFITTHLNAYTFRKRYGANSPIINAPLYFQKVPHKKTMNSNRNHQKNQKKKIKKEKVYFLPIKKTIKIDPSAVFSNSGRSDITQNRSGFSK